MSHGQQLIDLREAAALAQMSIPGIREMVKDDVFWHRTQGNRIMLRRDEVISYTRLRQRYLAQGGQRLSRKIVRDFLRGQTPIAEILGDQTPDVTTPEPTPEVTTHPEATPVAAALERAQITPEDFDTTAEEADRPAVPQLQPLDHLRATLTHQHGAIEAQIDGVVAEIARLEKHMESLMNAQAKITEDLAAVDKVEQIVERYR